MRRAPEAIGLVALLFAAGACGAILGLDDVDFDDDDAAVLSHCDNELLDADESAVDCGGSCAGCGEGETCRQDSDCLGGACDEVCGASCSDGARNGDEDGVDCGGTCPLCPGVEDCSEPGDEDGNLLADCADPVCWDSQCVPIPDGWLGPVTLVQARAAPGCPADWEIPFGEGFTGLSAQAAGCEACTCGLPLGGSCDDVLVELFGGGACNGAPKSVVVAGALCEELDQTGVDSIRVPLVMGTPGPCPPAGGKLNAPPPEWTGAVRVCMGTALGECGAGPCTPSPPDGAPVCVTQTGDHPCPETWSDRRPLYQPGGELDTRSCSPCACSAAMDGPCSAEVSLYMSFQCAFPSDKVQSDGLCMNTSAFGLDAVSLSKISPPTGTCAAAGGDPMGAVVPGEAEATVCCLPPRATPP